MRTGMVIARSEPMPENLEFAQVRERADRIAAIPASCRLTDQVEHLALGPGDFRQFNHCSRMIFGIEVDEATARADFTAHHSLESPGFEARQIRVVIFGPVGDVLQAGVTRLE